MEDEFFFWGPDSWGHVGFKEYKKLLWLSRKWETIERLRRCGDNFGWYLLERVFFFNLPTSRYCKATPVRTKRTFVNFVNYYELPFCSGKAVFFWKGVMCTRGCIVEHPPLIVAVILRTNVLTVDETPLPILRTREELGLKVL